MVGVGPGNPSLLAPVLHCSLIAAPRITNLTTGRLLTYYVPQLSIGDRVRLTPDGARLHREYQATMLGVAGAGVAGLAVPLAVPGAIGLAIAGTAVRIGFIAQAAAGAAAGAGIGGAIGGMFSASPEAGATGIVIKKQPRGFGQEGHDYLIEWHEPHGIPPAGTCPVTLKCSAELITSPHFTNPTTDRPMKPSHAFLAAALAITGLIAVAPIKTKPEVFNDITAKVDCEDPIKKTLKDPDSYQFDSARVFLQDVDRKYGAALILFRARNGYGGYAQGASICEARKQNDGSRGFSVSEPLPEWLANQPEYQGL